ncbi:hypothetical protein ABL78_8218 [Leptomonas seymouri]|uniref:Uncharacterized protein n=1 Tax=Leptomonas seymouri TaxID=5684 RepID=A0A0N1P9D0_LEPSE|nr:hypothetical protein ABL78_8218 [Leptomonas seymouri]|eukprot:KPI82770.1 hypothetical protein ABL78_8218 [Leptomonas seymouri]
MPRKTAVRGCDQAVFPFSVSASPSALSPDTSAPSTDRTSHVHDDVARFCLSLRQDERVRVLQRDRQVHHGMHTNSSISMLEQWCIAQREDGAVGLVPSSLLHRVPGVSFTLRRPSPTTAEQRRQQSPPTTVRRDPESGVSAVISPYPSKQRVGALELRRLRQHDSDEEEDVEDMVQLQRRRAGVQARVQTLQSPSRDVKPLLGETLKKSAATPLSDSSDAHARQPTHMNKSVPPDPDGGNEDVERLQLMDEAARMSAELRWLRRDVVPRLLTACTAAQGAGKTAEEDMKTPQPSSSSAAAAASPSTRVTRRGVTEEEKEMAAEQQRLAEQLEVARALKAWLGRQAAQPSDNDSNNEEDADLLRLANAMQHSGMMKPFSSRDMNLPSGNGTGKEGDAPYCTETTMRCNSHRSGQLCRLVREESETMHCYREQQRSLQQRLSSLNQLTSELTAEERVLGMSEMALKIVMAARTENVDSTAAPWPRSLPGLTDEEEAALCASVAMYEKYARKLQALGPLDESGFNANNADLRDVKGSLAGTQSATPCTDKSILSSLQATPERGPNTRAADALAGVGATSPSASPAKVVENLRQVLEKGDHEYLQLQTKLKALQEFCSTYGPAAHDIEVQLQRGQRILAEKRNYLVQLCSVDVTGKETGNDWIAQNTRGDRRSRKAFP